MGISATGTSHWSMTSLKASIAVVVGVIVLGFYMYGPPITPKLHAAAMDACNDHSGGNYRDFRLSWHVGVGPHWTCWDAGRPNQQAYDMGWWVSPVH